MRGKLVLVTGASRGVGLGLVSELLGRGASVMAAVRNPGASDQLNRLAQSLGSGDGGASGGDAHLHVVQLDVASGESIAACARELRGRFQHIDVLINNAGVAEDLKPFEEVTEQEFKDVYQTNAIGPFLLTQQLKVQGLIGQPGSLVVNISSVLGSIGFEGFADYPGYAYRASKAALNILTKRLDRVLSKDGIACVAIHPGYVKTEINKGGGDISAEESAQGILQVLESGRDLRGRFYAWNGEELPW